MRATSSIRSASRCTSAVAPVGHGHREHCPRRPRPRTPATSRIRSHRPRRDRLAEQPQRPAPGAAPRHAARPARGRRRSARHQPRAAQLHHQPRRQPLRRRGAARGAAASRTASTPRVRRPSAFEVRRMLGPTQVAASISTRVVLSETSDIWPPITPAMPDGPSASQTSAISRVERALDVVEGDHRLPLLRPAHDDLARRAPRPGRTRGAAGRVSEHHVVGDVHDVRDRALAGRRQPLLEPLRRRPDLDVLEHPGREAQADLRDRRSRRSRGPRPRRRRDGFASASVGVGAPAAAPVAACTSRATP